MKHRSVCTTIALSLFKNHVKTDAATWIDKVKNGNRQGAHWLLHKRCIGEIQNMHHAASATSKLKNMIWKSEVPQTNDLIFEQIIKKLPLVQTFFKDLLGTQPRQALCWMQTNDLLTANELLLPAEL